MTYSVLHNDEVSFILERNSEVSQESISRLAHNHGAEELTTKPSSTSRRDGSLNDGDLEIGTSLAKHVSSAETAGSGTDDDNVRLGVRVQVLEVATSHGTGDLGLADGSEREALLPFVGHVLEGLRLVAVHGKRLDVEAGLQGDAVDESRRLGVHCRRWCHVG
jgi:hypothetical protein